MTCYWYQLLCNNSLSTEELDAIYLGLKKTGKCEVVDRLDEWIKDVGRILNRRANIELTRENEEKFKNYSPNLTKEDWVEFLNDDEIISEDSLTLLDRFYSINKPTTQQELSKVFGYNPGFYEAEAERIAKRILNKTNKKIPILYFKIADSFKTGIIDREILWAILVKLQDKQYQLRDELIEAYKEVYKK